MTNLQGHVIESSGVLPPVQNPLETLRRQYTPSNLTASANLYKLSRVISFGKPDVMPFMTDLTAGVDSIPLDVSPDNSAFAQVSAQITGVPVENYVLPQDELYKKRSSTIAESTYPAIASYVGSLCDFAAEKTTPRTREDIPANLLPDAEHPHQRIFDEVGIEPVEALVMSTAYLKYLEVMANGLLLREAALKIAAITKQELKVGSTVNALAVLVNSIEAHFDTADYINSDQTYILAEQRQLLRSANARMLDLSHMKRISDDANQSAGDWHARSMTWEATKATIHSFLPEIWPNHDLSQTAEYSGSLAVGTVVADAVEATEEPDVVIDLTDTRVIDITDGSTASVHEEPHGAVEANAELVEDLHVLDWEVFPKGSTMEGIKKYALNIAERITNKRYRPNEIEWDRIERLLEFRDAFEGEFYMSSPKALNAGKVPYFVVRFEYGGESYTLADNPEYGNALYWFKDSDLEYGSSWMEVLAESRELARLLGAKRITHHGDEEGRAKSGDFTARILEKL